ncbi:MAG: response regulator [Betaproteobacteria bacterium]|nr:response regulator [Betaproteobacteria bacterium]
MAPQDHVLVVDDDAEIRNLLREYLEKNGYRVTTAADGKGLWAAINSTRPDLVVLDLMLPGDDGLTLCRDLRARSNVPIVMLTARGEETDRIVGLEMGADDYVPKPFNPRELLARIKRVLRRTRSLPGTEFKLLQVLLTRPNRILTRDQLIDFMMSREAGPFDRAIDVQVSRLRHRLGDDAKEPAIIKTVRGQGYVLAVPVNAER